MKKIFFIVIVALVLTRAAFPDEYREFTNQDGKSIHARIVQYDAEGERVQLELKNRKKAWVEIATLSDDDQEFIKQSRQKEPEKEVEPKEGEKPLSRNEIRAIAKKYVNSINNKDYELWSELYVDLGDKRVSRFDRTDEQNFTRTIDADATVSVGKVDGFNVLVQQVVDYSEYTRNGWLQILPDGKIKYDPVAYRHPIEEASYMLDYLWPGGMMIRGASNNNRKSARTLRDFKRLDIPTFGYDVKGSDQDRKTAVKQIVNWIIETEGDWDNSEPKLSLPEDVFEYCVRMIEQYL